MCCPPPQTAMQTRLRVPSASLRRRWLDDGTAHRRSHARVPHRPLGQYINLALQAVGESLDCGGRHPSRRICRRARISELLNECSKMTAERYIQALTANRDFSRFGAWATGVFLGLADAGNIWTNFGQFWLKLDQCCPKSAGLGPNVAQNGKSWEKSPCPSVRNARKSRLAVLFEHLLSKSATRARRHVRRGGVWRALFGHLFGPPPAPHFGVYLFGVCVAAAWRLPSPVGHAPTPLPVGPRLRVVFEVEPTPFSNASGASTES